MKKILLIVVLALGVSGVVNAQKSKKATSKKTTTDLYKSLSVDFHHRLKLGEVHESEKAIGMFTF